MSPLTSVTRVAIEKMILEYVKTSKYGYFMTEDQLGQIVERLVTFVATTRTLKARGDEIMQGKSHIKRKVSSERSP